MGRKSKKARMIKPFCYFCLREFDNEKVLIQHQKAKHFKCSECNRKLVSANGLLVHMQQVHKMAQRRVPNSLEGRDNINSSIRGMTGVPAEVIEEHRLQHFQKLNNLNKQKQQRISWTQVHAPGYSNLVNPSLLNPNLQANGTQVGGTGTTNSGLQQTNGLSSTLNTNKNVNKTSATNNLLNEDTFTADASEEMMSTSNKLLILDPNGMPIYQQVESTNQQQTNTTQTQSFLLQQQNKLGFKPSYSNLTQSGFDSGVQNYLPTSTGTATGSSMATGTVGNILTATSSTGSSFTSGPVSGLTTTSVTGVTTLSSSTGFTSSPPVFSSELPVFKHDVLTSTTNNIPNEDDTITTIYYKVTGLQPLYIPTPSLGNTKLSYTSDSVSIEELRAKVKYNWHETPS